MSLTTKNIISLLSLDGIGRTSVLFFAKYAEQSGFEIRKVDDYKELLSACHSIKGCRIKADNYSIGDFLSVEEKASIIIEESYKKGIGIISYSEEGFPMKLKSIVSKHISTNGKETAKDDSSVILYYRGKDIARLNDLVSVAIIGTREPTQEGERAGWYLAKEFAKQGINIVGGLATGCDTFAHKGAIESGGITTAFLAHGLHTVFPKENEALAEQIVSQGGFIVSEYPIGVEPYAPYFIERDRLQSGLADATVIIQTGINGGTMHAVHSTIDNGKPLFAVKYSSDEVMRKENVIGNLQMIQDGVAAPINSSNVSDCISLVIRNHNKLGVIGEQLSLW